MGKQATFLLQPQVHSTEPKR